MQPIAIISFILTACFLLFGLAAFVKLMWFSIQRGQWADLLFGWQDRLDRWDDKAQRGSGLHLFLFKAGGGCDTCFSFWLSFLLLPAFWAVVICALRAYPMPHTTGGWLAFLLLYQVCLFALAYTSHLLISFRKK